MSSRPGRRWPDLWKSFLLVFLPMAFGLGAVVLMFHQLATGVHVAGMQNQERQQLVLESAVVRTELANLADDLIFTAREVELLTGGDPGVSPLPEILGRTLSLFTQHKAGYDQLRILDLNGRERLRVNLVRGQAVLVPEAQLQDKSKRYYFRELQDLPPGRIYISPFDLNQENGRLERPFKPVIRLGTVLVDSQGQRRGYLLINFLGQRLMDQLRAVHVNVRGNLRMVDPDGYWLIGGTDSERAWGRYLPQGRDQTMAVTAPGAWKRIAGREDGQFVAEGGIYTFATLHPQSLMDQLSRGEGEAGNFAEGALDQGGNVWKLISHIPRRALDQERQDAETRMLVIYLGLVCVLAFGSWLVARFRLARLEVQEELIKTNDALAEYVRRLEKHNREVDLINSLGDLMQACDLPEDTYPIVGQYAGDLFPGDSGALYILETKTGQLHCRASWGDAVCGANTFLTQDCWALRRGRLHLNQPGETTLRCAHLEDLDAPGGSLCVPMVAHGQVMGLFSLSLGSHRHPESPTLRSQALSHIKKTVTTVADLVALSLANLNLRESLRVQSIRDPLTGLFNRRHMEESLLRELDRAGRRGEPLGLIMLDVDHFKVFNDQHGHEAGDKVLAQLGAMLAQNSRIHDIACRYGGEEFLLILPGASLTVCQRRADELRVIVESRLKVEMEGRTLPGVTISLGVAVYPEHGNRPETLQGAADQALYAAKRAGRNRVEVAPLPGQPAKALPRPGADA